jgi:hypothetical protein
MSVCEIGFPACVAAGVAAIADDVTQRRNSHLRHDAVHRRPLVLEMLALHHVTDRDRRFWSHAAVIFASMYAVFVSANYVVQLATTIPARLTEWRCGR